MIRASRLCWVPLLLGGHAAWGQPPRILGCTAANAGTQESATCQQVQGWAWDANQPNTPISVDILADGVLKATIVANRFRQDLLNGGIGDGNHGFRYVMPISLRNGAAHSMLARFNGTTTALSGAPQSTPFCPVPPGNFYTVTPCRAVDTRLTNGPLGGPALTAGVTRYFDLTGACGIPITAEGVSLNVTVLGSTAAGALHIFPDGTVGVPTATAISYSTNQTRANNALIAPGAGTLAVNPEQASGTVHVLIDVNGYFQ